MYNHIIYRTTVGPGECEYCEQVALKFNSGPCCCISCLSEIQTENDKDCIWEEGRLRGLTSDTVEVQRASSVSSQWAAFPCLGLNKRLWVAGVRRRKKKKVREDVEVRDREEIGAAEFDTARWERRDRGCSCGGDKVRRCMDSEEGREVLKGYRGDHERASFPRLERDCQHRACDAAAPRWPAHKEEQRGNSSNTRICPHKLHCSVPAYLQKEACVCVCVYQGVI